MPPTTTTTKMMEPTVAAIDGSVTKVMPPITPARPASAQPLPNTSMKTKGTLCPSDSTASGCVSAAWITKPMRVRVSISHSDSSIKRATNIMKVRVAGYGEQAATLHSSADAEPSTTLKPCAGDCTSVKAEPCSHVGGGNDRDERPQMSCTSSRLHP